MKKIIFILGTLLLVNVNPAFASFEKTNCSSADGKIKYQGRFPADPGKERLWFIDKMEISNYSENLKIKKLMGPQIIEEVSTSVSPGMTGRSVYAYKVKLTYLDEQISKETKTIETWLICDSTSGI